MDRNGVLAKRLNRLGRWCGGKVTVHVSFADVLFKLKTRVGSKKWLIMIFGLFVMII